jgi:hypothetical protein
MQTEDRWYVEVGGSVQMMTLDELVEGYEAGRISAKTLVTEVGASEWHTLAEVADLPDEDAAESVAPPVQAAPPAAVAPAVTPPLPAQVGQASRVSAAQSFPPTSVAAESAWPPAAAWSSRAPGAPSVAPAAASPSFAPNSTVPVVQDFDLGGVDMPFKRSKGKTFGIALAAVAVIGLAGFGITRASSAPPAPAVPVPAAAALAGPSPASLGDWKTPLNPVPAAPKAEEPAAPSEEQDKKADDSRLSDDVKAKLADKDKDQVAKKKAVRSTRAVRSSARSSSGSVFRSGGSADDPLNSKL